MEAAMQTELDLFNAFAAASNMDKKHYPWADRRKEGEVYSNCVLIGAQGHEWWRHYIGVEFLGRLRFRYNEWTKKQELYEVEPVRLTNTMAFRGRSINIECVTLI